MFCIEKELFYVENYMFLGRHGEEFGWSKHEVSF